MNVALDWLLKGRVFKSTPLNLHIEGSLSRQTPQETFLADMLLSGIQPNHYNYFLFRNSSEPTINKIDVVFFNNDGSGYAVGIPSKLISEFSDNRIVFSFVLKGGGEAGHVTTKRTFSFSRPSDSENRRLLKAVLEEESVTSSMWSGRRKEKGRAEMQFASAELAEALIEAAREMDIGKKNQPTGQPKHGEDQRANQ